MTETLERLIERARRHVMTPEEIFEQKVSWIWGMQKFSPGPGGWNSIGEFSMDQIREALRRLPVLP